MIIPQAFACLKGKGVDGARNALKEILRNANSTDYILKADLKDYFGSINHKLICEELSQYITDEWELSYFADVIGANSVDVGISLGSEINQLSAVAFLNALDHRLEGQYVRYMDDMIYVGDREAVERAYRIICEETDRLGLRLSKKKTYFQPVTRPVRFLGFSFLRHPTGRITLKRLRDKLMNEKRKLKRMKKKGIPIERIEEHYRCVRANMKKGSRSDLRKLDHYYKELFNEGN